MSARVSVSAKKHLAIGLKLDPSSTINGFNFSFTSMLLGKLKKLIEEGRLSQHEIVEANRIELTPIAEMVLVRLFEQIPLCVGWSGQGCSISKREIDNLIATTTEFLAIFEENLK